MAAQRVIHHGSHKGTRQDATRNESRESHSDSGAQSQAPKGDPCGRLPPGVIREIASQRSSNGGTKLPVKTRQADHDPGCRRGCACDTRAWRHRRIVALARVQWVRGPHH